jgi:hypothetical protein
VLANVEFGGNEATGAEFKGDGIVWAPTKPAANRAVAKLGKITFICRICRICQRIVLYDADEYHTETQSGGWRLGCESEL